MMNPEIDWHTALVAVLKRAAVDANFRTLCLEDAIGALRVEGGFSLPAHSLVRFVDRDAPPQEGTEMLFIPLPILRSSDEITDDELDAVSAGSGYYNAPFTYYCSGAAE